MYLHPAPTIAARSTPDQLSGCPPSYPLCDPSLSAGPALAASGEDDPAAITTGGLAPVPQPQAALASTTVQHIGQRNLVGIIVAAVLVFLGLVLWLSFGRWPRAGMRRIRARLARGDASKRAAKSAGGGFGSAPGHERDEACVRDDKRGSETGEAGRYCESPLPAEIEVDGLDKDGGTGPRHVHFA
ncbi:hypothetical protein TRAPUB_10535 [Trametes pubescens]|uniref:Uncharacterized protein n=1 Tax=Trametes pubescens TaxID=154538 RepID=A0A1M2VZL1_TRAPU|nr:hypothetical protein TRAPUB_10535 [Trametes pubescens]